MDKFSQLVEDLNNNKLCMKHIQNALRVHTRERKNIPDGIKDLLAGSSKGLMPSSGLIRNIFKIIDEIEGALELAYRRGYQAGVEDYVIASRDLPFRLMITDYKDPTHNFEKLLEYKANENQKSK